ncbi:hypothetical protein D3C71_363260 [compost metagenome]
MSTVIGKMAGGSHRRAASGVVGADDRRVLPRPLRRVVRFAVSLATGRIDIPAHAGTLSTFACFSLP